MAIRSPNLPLNQTEIDFVANLVETAGKLAVSMRPGVAVSHKSSPEDKVTAADLAISKLLISGLRERFKQDAVISEEGEEEDPCPSLGKQSPRVWLIDPIDGTANYIANDGEYCVMIGLLIDRQAAFGWIYAPQTGTLYFGGPGYGSFRKQKDTVKACETRPPLALGERARLVMGERDCQANAWVKDLSNLTLLQTGSVGLKTARIVDGEADLFAHLSGKLKAWDTAGPTAVALGAGLDVGEFNSANLLSPLPEIKQGTSVIIGRKGALAWCREHLREPYAK